MTDKEKIIVDGVDVSGCRYYSAEHKLDFSNCGHICEGTECKYKRLWYKKQLKRKEQECEELKKLKDEVYKENKRIRKLLALEKPLIETLSNIDIIVAKFRSNQKEDKYINIFEDIKRVVKAIDEFNNNNVQSPTLEISKFEKILETNKYKQALDEIEQYCNHKFCDKFGEFTELINKKSILDIINKAKDGE